MRTQVLPFLNAAERNVMEELLAGASLNHRQATRLQIVWVGRMGKGNELADVLRIHPVSVSVIVRRFNNNGVDGLLKQPITCLAKRR